jgi:HEAT repeat protein
MSKRFSSVAVALVAGVVIATAAAAQAPRIGNSRLTTQAAGTPFVQSFRSLVGAQTEAAWLGYVVPVVEGERRMCCSDSGATYMSGSVVMVDGRSCCATCRLEPSAAGSAGPPRPQSSAAPIQLEAPTQMAVLFRVADKQVERIRVFSSDCELDAGGRQVIWLENVRPADSIALLESLIPKEPERRDRVTDGAISAIALHRDSAADAALDRLVAPNQPASVRKKVTFWLGNARGAHGMTVLRQLLDNDPSEDVRKGAVFGISQSEQPGAYEVLVQAARGNSDPDIRGEAIFWLGQKAGAKASAAITESIDKDPETEVKKRAVFALSQLPKNDGVPLLIKVARTNANPAVRKQAMFWLAQSKDPRAIDFFAEILK